MSLDVQANDDSSSILEAIQSRPLPAPPTPARSKASNSKKEEASASEVFHSFKSSATLVASPNRNQDSTENDDTLADSLLESMHTCADTIQSDDATLHSCADTLNAGDGDLGSDDEAVEEMLPYDGKNKDENH